MNAIKNEFIIYLNKLKDELLKYKDENDIWKLAGDIKNTPGNLAVHVCGNLKYNIGTVIGNNGYIRKRDEEFSVKGLSKIALISEIDSTLDMIEPILDNLAPEDMNKPFPENIHEPEHTYGTVLTKIAHHFGYHLGQINFHRRLLTK
jgi:hypothetical protein